MTLTKIASTGVEDSLRWVLGANGTSDYTFTGPGLTGTVNDPTIYLTRGHTYIFQNNSGGHPFYIKTSIANGGTNDAYNTGVTNNGGGNGTEIVFTVPHDSPDILYYQCSSHASMAGQFNIAGSVADGSISTAKIADDAVNNDKLANSVVAAIAANTAKTSNATHTGDVTGSTSLTIANNAVTQAKIADDAVGTDQIATSSITNNRLSNDAVTTAKIADQAVTTGKLANDAVDYGKLADGAVLASKLATNSVQTAKIVDEAVTLAKLPHGTSSNDGKFLRANNGADPTFETVNTDLVADTSPQLGGDLQTNGNHIGFADNNKARFGNGNDLDIYHDGSDSYLDDSGPGIIYAKGTTSTVFGVQHTGNNSVYINFKHTGHHQNYIGYEDDHFTVYTKNSGANTHSQRINVDASGLAFHGDTAAANRLNDYEEGTFSPGLGRSGSNPSASFYTRQGRYVKIGKLVYCSVLVDAYNVSGGSGHWYCSNFPFNTYNDSNIGWANAWVMGRLYFDGDYAAGVDAMTLRANHNTNTWYLYNQDDDTSVQSNASRIIFQGHVTFMTN